MPYDAADWLNRIALIPEDAPGLTESIIEQASAPSPPLNVGRGWRDTSMSPPLIWRWDGSQFVVTVEQENLDRMEAGIGGAHTELAGHETRLDSLEASATPGQIIATASSAGTGFDPSSPMLNADGIALAAGDLVLHISKTDQTKNGPWLNTTPWQRPAFFAAGSVQKRGYQVYVQFGTARGGKTYYLNPATGTITVGDQDGIPLGDAQVWTERPLGIRSFPMGHAGPITVGDGDPSPALGLAMTLTDIYSTLTKASTSGGVTYILQRVTGNGPAWTTENLATVTLPQGDDGPIQTTGLAIALAATDRLRISRTAAGTGAEDLGVTVVGRY
jgi:hypothetical protein